MVSTCRIRPARRAPNVAPMLVPLVCALFLIRCAGGKLAATAAERAPSIGMPRSGALWRWLLGQPSCAPRGCGPVVGSDPLFRPVEHMGWELGFGLRGRFTFSIFGFI
jgi:hypothetical protein